MRKRRGKCYPIDINVMEHYISLGIIDPKPKIYAEKIQCTDPCNFRQCKASLSDSIIDCNLRNTILNLMQADYPAIGQLH